MKTYTISVPQIVEVTIDETKFTQEWMEDFRQHFYEMDSIEDHAKHLGHLAARGLITWMSTFCEGYGDLGEMGIKVDQLEVHDVEILNVVNS